MDIEALIQMTALGRMGGESSVFDYLAILLMLVVSWLVRSNEMRRKGNALIRRLTDGNGKNTRIISSKRLFSDRGVPSDTDGTRLLQNAIIRHINAIADTWKVSFTVMPDRSVLRADNMAVIKKSVVNLPPFDEWVDIGNGIRFKRTESNMENEGRITEQETCYYLTGRNQDICDFVDTAMDSYRKFLSKDSDDRFLYMPYRVPVQGGDSSRIFFRRYKLSDDKTFDTVVMPRKDDVLHMVDQFQQKTGKFAVPGFPSKLGFLLHGPPGTGKTSFIKALATHTNRNIVTIGLDKIRTNHELMEVMNDLNFIIDGLDDRVDLEYKDVIFVMEDIDAVGGVVRNRSNEDSVSDAEASDSIKSVLSKALADVQKDKHAASVSLGNSDSLNLAGILNVLDGILDSPDRIVVMTTNHPEKLDPALVRPGRVNMHLHMGNIRPKEASQMISRYFKGCDPSALDLEFLAHAEVSPARVEALCGYHDSVVNLIAALKSE